MKRANKYISLALALIMALSLCVTSFAANGKITLNNAIPGEDYQLYKLFDATYRVVGDKTVAAYTYTKSGETDALLTALEATDSPFALEETTETGVYNVELKDGMDVDDIIDFINANMTIIPKVGEVKEAPEAAEDQERSSVEWTGLDFGYYFIDSSLGSLVTIDNATPTATVEDKNDFPTLTKLVKEDDATENEWNTSAKAEIGQVVEFKLTTKVVKGVDKNYVIEDAIPAGMTFNKESVVVKNGDAAWTLDTDYTVTDDATITLIYGEETKLGTLAAETAIVITYNATVDTDAVIEGVGNINTAELTYGTYVTPEVEATVYVYDFTLTKVDGADKTTVLNGAKFKLYNVEENGTAYKFTKNENTYTVDPQGTIEEIEVGTAVIKGLDDQNYWLEETVAPLGYNKLTNRVSFNPFNAENEVEFKVENNSGATLPSTGGVGTTMFYVLGSVMMIGAAVLLVTKKKMAGEQ